MHRRQAAMDIQQQIHIGTDRIAHRPQNLYRATDVLLGDVGPPRTRHRVELHRAEAALDYAFRGARIVFRLLQLVAPAVRVDADARPARSASRL